MKHKSLTILLFIIVCLGFGAGYMKYHQKLQDNLNKVIIQDNSLAFNVDGVKVETPAVDKETPKPEIEKDLKSPELIRVKRKDALEMVKNAKLKSEIIEEYSAVFEKDVVFWQSIPANTLISSGETLSYAVSLGAKDGVTSQGDTIIVPEMIGLTEKIATVKLIALGFKVEYEYNPNSDYRSGMVYSQNYKVDAKVAKGTSIIIRVSTGS